MRRMARAGTLQLACGVVDAWFYGAVAWALCGNVCGAITESAGNVGGLCGWAACALVPLGWLEIAVGLHTWRTGDLTWSRRLAVLEVLAIGIGGVPSAVVGATVWVTTRGWPRPAGPA
ncbi:MAG: hypothetical protein R3F61_13485 [Myxococcota bacterium]